jgi:hypothetical protein
MQAKWWDTPPERFVLKADVTVVAADYNEAFYETLRLRRQGIAAECFRGSRKKQFKKATGPVKDLDALRAAEQEIFEGAFLAMGAADL